MKALRCSVRWLKVALGGIGSSILFIAGLPVTPA